MRRAPGSGTARGLGAFVYEPGAPDAATGAPMPDPDNARDWLGRRGLLGKNRATRMALCAAHGLTVLRGAEAPPGGRTGVVVSSNFSNADVVIRDASRLYWEGEAALSPVDAPTHSANIIGSSLAIRHEWRGPNVSVCSGRRAGAEALEIASLLLAAGRCDRVVVLGVDDAVPAPFLAMDESDRPLAAAVLLGRGRTPSAPSPEPRHDDDALLPRYHGARHVLEAALDAASSDLGDRLPV